MDKDDRSIPTSEPGSLIISPIENAQIFEEGYGDSIPVIFSHGGAPCDIAAAVYFAKHPDVDLIGMVLSRGEFHPEIALNKWRVFIHQVLGLTETNIGIGSDRRLDPDSHEFPAEWRPFADDFWGLELPPGNYDQSPMAGHEMIIELVNSSPDKVTIIAMASMIDVAMALMQDPGIIDKIAHVVIMGGAINVPGNLSDAPYPISNQVAEWNMWIDAEAARVVFESDVPVSLVPLDAIQYLVQPADISQINLINDPWVDYVAQMWNQQIVWSDNTGFLIWDAITATAITNPENFHWIHDGIEVITQPGDFQGQTVPLGNSVPHIRYASSANYSSVMDQLFYIFQIEPAGSSSIQVISTLSGTWKGATENFSIIFSLGDECVINQVCGTFEIPDFGLTGDVTIVAVEGNRYEFKSTNLSSGGTGSPYEYIELLHDGTLKYYTTDYQNSSEAILTRTEP